MLIKYQIQKSFQSLTAQTIVVSGVTSGLYKSITVPISNNFYPVDYDEDVMDIVLVERKKAINATFDAETTKYTFPNVLANNGQGLLISFRFWNVSATTYDIAYSATNFTVLDIRNNNNGFKKSFFRLYFYDSNSADTSNLIFTEDLVVHDTTTPIMSFNRLYWLRNDNYFINTPTATTRTVYMDARFFNAKTGKVIKFYNLPATYTNPILAVLYSNPMNSSWRTSAIDIRNPIFNNGAYNFQPTLGSGANTPIQITLSELILS